MSIFTDQPGNQRRTFGRSNPTLFDLNGHELVILVPAFTALRQGFRPFNPKTRYFLGDGTRI